MKIFFRFAIVAIMAIMACLTMTSCEPDDVDAFAKGYRDGYYGSRSATSGIVSCDAVPTDPAAEQ